MFPSQAEQRVVSDAGMQYVNVPMTGHTPPTEAEITKILAVLEEGTTGPVFVHCQRGADRTGAVIAAYHIDHDKWDNSRALQDAKSHSMSVFQFQRQKYIQDFRPRIIDAKATSPADGAVAVLPVAATPAEAGIKN